MYDHVTIKDGCTYTRRDTDKKREHGGFLFES